MHYVRFLRAPTARAGQRGAGALDLVLTLTNDLGESLLQLQRPLELLVTLHRRGEAAGPLEEVTGLSVKGQVVWRPGSRVIKTTIDLPPAVYESLQRGAEGGTMYVQVRPLVMTVVAESASKIMGAAEGRGLIMPAWHRVSDGSMGGQVVYRHLALGRHADMAADLMIGEEIKDSIARHVWDGGVTALCAIAEAMSSTTPVRPPGPAVSLLRNLVTAKETRTVLELGCGIGTLGLGLASLCDMRDDVTEEKEMEILMTDLEDAEEIMEVNLKGYEARRPLHDGEQAEQAKRKLAKIDYENLDWEEARHGTFGEKAQASPWDLIILSDCTYNEDTLAALVDTLSAIHAHNLRHHDGAGATGTKPTRLFLATKHRHESELEAFALLRKAGWAMLADETVQLPFLEGESQKVQMCVFEKV